MFIKPDVKMPRALPAGSTIRAVVTGTEPIEVTLNQFRGGGYQRVPNSEVNVREWAGLPPGLYFVTASNQASPEDGDTLFTYQQGVVFGDDGWAHRKQGAWHFSAWCFLE